MLRVIIEPRQRTDGVGIAIPLGPLGGRLLDDVLIGDRFPLGYRHRVPVGGSDVAVIECIRGVILLERNVFRVPLECGQAACDTEDHLDDSN